MKLIIFGANGGIGSQVVEQAVAAGHDVTAVARRPQTVTLQDPHLKVVRGDVMEPASIRAAMVGQDAVISALGVAKREPTTLYSQGVTNIIQAMEGAGMRRLLCISATGLDPGPLVQRVFAKPILWTILKDMYTDLVRMETVVSRSPLDWTIIRPPMLTNKPRTGQYRVAINRHLEGCWRISRADLADYILNHLNDPASYCELVEVAY